MVKETQSEALKKGFLRIGSSEKRRDEFLGRDRTAGGACLGEDLRVLISFQTRHTDC